MKSNSIIPILFITGSLIFSGCAYKQTSGVNTRGQKYTDTTYRSYNTNNPCYPKNIKFSNARSRNFVTPIPKYSAQTVCQQAQPICQQAQPICQQAQQVSPKPPVKEQIHKPVIPKNTPILSYNKPLQISVIGQGVAPVNTSSPAQAYALAKRAAVADAYRLIAEKVKGVYVEGNDYIKNMMVKRSSVKTSVQAMIRNTHVVETTFKEGLCEVEMEITLSRSQFPQ